MRAPPALRPDSTDLGRNSPKNFQKCIQAFTAEEDDVSAPMPLPGAALGSAFSAGAQSPSTHPTRMLCTGTWLQCWEHRGAAAGLLPGAECTSGGQGLTTLVSLESEQSKPVVWSLTYVPCIHISDMKQALIFISLLKIPDRIRSGSFQTTPFSCFLVFPFSFTMALFLLLLWLWHSKTGVRGKVQEWVLLLTGTFQTLSSCQVLLTQACTMHWRSLSAWLLLPHLQHQQKTNPHAQAACEKGIEEHECDKMKPLSTHCFQFSFALQT